MRLLFNTYFVDNLPRKWFPLLLMGSGQWPPRWWAGGLRFRGLHPPSSLPSLGLTCPFMSLPCPALCTGTGLPVTFCVHCNKSIPKGHEAKFDPISNLMLIHVRLSLQGWSFCLLSFHDLSERLGHIVDWKQVGSVIRTGLENHSSSFSVWPWMHNQPRSWFFNLLNEDYIIFHQFQEARFPTFCVC